MITLFSIRNTTGETWPAYAIGRLGPVVLYDGVNSDVPLYHLLKPDGTPGIYVVNGPSPLPHANEGTAIHYLDTQYLAVQNPAGVFAGTLIGAVRYEWLSYNGGMCQMMATDVPNEDNIVPVTQPTNLRIQVVMKDDLLAAVNVFDDPSEADAYLLVKNAAGNMVKTRIIKRITNRFEDISVDAGQYAKAEAIDGEWQLYAANCPRDSQSESEPFVSEEVFIDRPIRDPLPPPV